VKHRELLQRLQGLTEAASGSHSSAVSFQNEIFKLTTLLHSALLARQVSDLGGSCWALVRDRAVAMGVQCGL